MAWENELDLIKVDEQIVDGETVITETKTNVYTTKKSVRQTEFYQSAGAGIRLEVVFEIHSFEYNGETLVEFEGKRYIVERSFDKNSDTVELICRRL